MADPDGLAQVIRRGARSLFAAGYYPLRLARLARDAIGQTRTDQLRVLLYHDIAPHQVSKFAAQMRWLSRRWRFVDAEHFQAMVLGDEPVSGASLLLTFDDGFTSDRVVAERVLAPMGIRGLFFVTAGLVESANAREARDLLRAHAYRGLGSDAIPAHWDSMRWPDLEALLEQGHSIGAHGVTHARLSDLSSEAELAHEICGGADLLEQRLGIDVSSFAYPFGNLDSFSQEASAIAQKRFRFVFSGLRGRNEVGVSPHALRRDSAAPSDSVRYLGMVLEGGLDWRYAESRRVLDGWSGAVG